MRWTPGALPMRRRMLWFTRVARVWLAAAVVLGLACAVRGPSRITVVLAIVCALRALAVPRREVLVEVWLLASVSTGFVAGWAVGALVAVAGLALLQLTALRLRPESATQPLVGFDLCHILLTSPIRGSTTHHFLELGAPLERTRLTRALAELAADVPRLRSFVREGVVAVERFAAPALWVAPEALIDWHDEVVEPVASGWFERPIDLASEPPVRLFHAPRAGGGFLFGLTLHHSVADGSGAMVLLDGLLRRYDRALDATVLVPPIASDGPRCRRLVWRFGVSRVWGMLLAAARLGSRGVVSASLLDDERPRPARFGLRVVDLPPALWRQVAEFAKRDAVTPNHLLIAASLRAADRVRRAREKPDQTFRVVLPSDLRTLFGLPRSLPNYIGTVPLAVRPDEVRADGLPALVRTRIQAGRTPEAQLGFPIQLGLVGLLPPVLGRRLLAAFDRDPRTFAFSFLFSHIRVPRELHLPSGNEVTRLWCASSQGRQPAFGVAVTTIGERTWALLQYLTPYVSEDAVDVFGRELLVQLRALTETHAGKVFEGAARSSSEVACEA